MSITIKKGLIGLAVLCVTIPVMLVAQTAEKKTLVGVWERSAILASARALWFGRSKSLSAHPDKDLAHLNDDSPSSHHVGKGCSQVLRKSFGPSRIRTDDQGIMSPLL